MTPPVNTTLAVLAGALVATGCAQGPGSPQAARMANPASEHCVRLGGKVEIRKDAAGNETGMCHLPDGRVVDEWELFRRDHPRPRD